MEEKLRDNQMVENETYKRIQRKEAEMLFKKITVNSGKYPYDNMNHLLKQGEFIQRAKLRNVKIPEPLKITINFKESPLKKIEYAFSGKVNIKVDLFRTDSTLKIITKKDKLEHVKNLVDARALGDKAFEWKIEENENGYEEQSKAWENIDQEIITKKTIRLINRPNAKSVGDTIVIKIEKFEEKGNPNNFEIEEGGVPPPKKVDLDMPILSYFKIFCDISDKEVQSKSKREVDKKSSFFSFKKIKDKEEKSEKVIDEEKGETIFEFDFSKRKNDFKGFKTFGELLESKRTKKVDETKEKRETKKSIKLSNKKDKGQSELEDEEKNIIRM